MAKYRKYSKGFKLQASKLVTEQRYSYEQAAKQLGITSWSVRNWIQKKIYETLEGTKKDIFNYIEVFYNRKHRHESLGNVSPVVYEEMYEMKQDWAA